MIRVAITGPECTGKSTLAAQLASRYQAKFVPEYARDYIAGLGRPYTYQDVEHIAKVQVQQVNEISNGDHILFLDTYLVITKVWFEIVYGHYPPWIDNELRRGMIDLYLLCDTGIPWVPDNVRENGGIMREKLFLRYQSELENLKSNYVIITGTGQQRFLHATEAIDHFFPDICRNQ